jgi:hypothetical protein|tara:strand:+ start:370 stop:630 length:261 start_codon:yes stop_codon:yes gene_type:complete
MRISSSIGNFDLDITGVKIEGKNLVVLGKMGVWEGAKMVLTPQDMAFMARKSLRPALLFYMVRFPVILFRYIRLKRSRKPETREAG